MSAQSDNVSPPPNAFLRGIRAAFTSVFSLVMIGTFVGIGALAHDFGFSALWLSLSTLLVWAAPAQVILISTLGTGAPIEVAIAVSLSGMRLFPMVVALLPLLRSETTSFSRLILPTHFTAISVWVESLRLLPPVPREQRIAYCNGLSVAYIGNAVISGLVGFYLAAGLPPLFAGALLFLTPMSFLISTARNARLMVDRLALVLGLIVGPLFTAYQVGLDLMWTGVIGGTLAYAFHRVRRVVR